MYKFWIKWAIGLRLSNSTVNHNNAKRKMTILYAFQMITELAKWFWKRSCKNCNHMEPLYYKYIKWESWKFKLSEQKKFLSKVKKGMMNNSVWERGSLGYSQVFPFSKQGIVGIKRNAEHDKCILRWVFIAALCDGAVKRFRRSGTDWVKRANSSGVNFRKVEMFIVIWCSSSQTVAS